MTGFEPGYSRVGSNRGTNCATTTFCLNKMLPKIAAKT